MEARLVDALGRNQARAAGDLEAHRHAVEEIRAGDAIAFRDGEERGNDHGARVHRAALERVVVILAVGSRAVHECGVVAVPDEERGHVVKAFIVLKPGFDGSTDLVRELQDFVKAEIAPYKYPRRIEFVERLPRTDTGKLQRFRLREQETA